MINMTLQNIAAACKGEYHGGDGEFTKEVAGITLDSRQIKENWLFVATKGERVDGHSFMNQVYQKGAICAISEKELESEEFYKGQPYILVKDSFQALKDMAEFYLKQLDVKVVGITGSVGKTSTKEMIAGVLSEKYNVLKTAGNFNNEVGLPLTVFRLTKEHEVAVLEMGISDFGEMTRLSQIARPDIAVITNIGQCHLEQLGDRDGVLKAKTEVFQNMKVDGEVVLFGDDDKLSTVTQVHGKKPYYFHKVECVSWMPEEVGCQDRTHMVYADCINNLGLAGCKCKIHLPDGILEAEIHVPGSHQVNNAAAAATVGMLLGLTKEEIARGIAKVEPISGRTRLVQKKDYLFVDDCYNANPVSMKAAIELMETATTRKVVVLGDMFELGTNEEKLHYDVGVFAGNKNVDVIIAIGKLARNLYEGVLAQDNPNQKIFYFEDKKSFFEKADAILKKGDSVLVKASHGMKFHEILEHFE